MNHNNNDVYKIPIIYSDRPPKITVDDMNKLKIERKMSKMSYND